jgi:hypothetical protein
MTSSPDDSGRLHLEHRVGSSDEGDLDDDAVSVAGDNDEHVLPRDVLVDP